jgi:hypothetical protein
VTAFTPPVRRRNYGNGHGYVDAKGLKVPSVTAITRDGLPKPGLIGGAANATAAYAVDNWTELSALTPDARMWELQKAYQKMWAATATLGTRIHTYMPPLLAGEAIEEVPDDLSGYIASLVRFLDDWAAEAVLTEAVVVSYTHGYSGTLDLIADLTDPDGFGTTERWLIDTKTGSTVYGDVALQLAGYRYADVYSEYPDGESPMPTVERVGVLHIREDGYDLVPVEAGPAQFRAFLAAMEVAEFRETADTLIGPPLTPPRADEEIAEVFA